jgi:hypothetical protein
VYSVWSHFAVPLFLLTASFAVSIIMLLLLLGRSSLGKRYRDRRHSWDSDHSHSVTLVTKREARKRWWKEADSWPLNALVGGVGVSSFACSPYPRTS